MNDDPEDRPTQHVTPPKPVRDGLPASAGKAGGAADAPGGEQRRRRGRGRGGRKRGGRRDHSSRRDDRARPTPVRESLGSSDGGDRAPQIRTFTGGEREWVARTAGRALAGPGANRGAPLLHLTFHRAEEEALPVREIMVVGETLEHLSDDDLADLLGQARAYREPERQERAGQKGRKRGL